MNLNAAPSCDSQSISTAMTDHMTALGTQLRQAAPYLAQSSNSQRNQALMAIAAAVSKQAAVILAANEHDCAQATHLSSSLRDRLALTPARIAAMADSIAIIAALPDPLEQELSTITRPNGLIIRRVSVPIGIIGIIYEARPNVTIDSAALCLKSGNAVLLRGGSECLQTNKALYDCITSGLRQAGFPGQAVCLVDRVDRGAVGLMLEGLAGHLDMIIPRGGRSLVERVKREARIPVLAHLEGNCHIYLHGDADLAMARRVIVNAKMRRTSICGALETLLIDQACAATHLPPIAADLRAAGCRLRGDAACRNLVGTIEPADEDDWYREYLDAVLAIRVVDGLDAAIAHIGHYGSNHTDAILCHDTDLAERFFRRVDSAIVIHNSSTQFADGGEFGMGAEIGIATGKFHARGPVGARELTTYHYRVSGQGQIRD